MIEAVKKDDAPVVTYAQVADKIKSAKDAELLDVATDLIGEVADPWQRAELSALAKQRREELTQ